MTQPEQTPTGPPTNLDETMREEILGHYEAMMSAEYDQGDFPDLHELPVETQETLIQACVNGRRLDPKADLIDLISAVIDWPSVNSARTADKNQSNPDGDNPPAEPEKLSSFRQAQTPPGKSS